MVYLEAVIGFAELGDEADVTVQVLAVVSSTIVQECRPGSCWAHAEVVPAC